MSSLALWLSRNCAVFESLYLQKLNFRHFLNSQLPNYLQSIRETISRYSNVNEGKCEQ